LSGHGFQRDRGWLVDVVDFPFPGKNHDAWALADNAASVVDGATPLETDWPTDLKRFSQAVAAALIGARVGLPLQAVWENAIVALRSQFSPQGYRRSAAAALVRETGGQLEFSALGDVKCLIETAENTLQLLDTRVIDLDLQAARSGSRQAFIDNRKKANTPDGYPIFSDDPRASERITTLVLDSRVVRSFALLSDGAWQHLDPNPAVALDSLGQGDLREAFKRQVERSGRPLADDATIIRVTARSPGAWSP
jgi:hypothetical protein